MDEEELPPPPPPLDDSDSDSTPPSPPRSLPPSPPDSNPPSPPDSPPPSPPSSPPGLSPRVIDDITPPGHRSSSIDASDLPPIPSSSDSEDEDRSTPALRVEEDSVEAELPPIMYDSDNDTDDETDKKQQAALDDRTIRHLRQKQVVATEQDSDREDFAPVTPFQRMLVRQAWEVSKCNRFGLRQQRTALLDPQDKALRFFHKDKVKTEFPITVIRGAQRQTDKSNCRAILNFYQRDPYDLIFKSSTDADEFCEAIRDVISVVEAKMASKHSLSVDIGQTGGRRSVTNRLGRSIGHKSELNGGIDEELDQYLDYHVLKKNKLHIQQKRILVLNVTNKTLQLLDARRKFIKAFPLTDVLHLEIPIPKNKPSRSASVDVKDGEIDASLVMFDAKPKLFIVFKKKVGQRAFEIEFEDSFDRIHFLERSRSLHPGITIKDDSKNMENLDCLRFSVFKSNKLGVRKKRIIAILSKQRIIRSFNRSKDFKDIPVDSILKIEKPVDHDTQAHLWLGEDRCWALNFSDRMARERFCCQCHYLRSQTLTPSKRAAVEKPLTIYTGSWNLGNAPFPEIDLNEWIPPNQHDVYIIAFQECSSSERDRWIEEIKCHVSNSRRIDDINNYVVVQTVKLWEIIIIVLVRRPLWSFITNVESSSIACGVGDMLGNKGGVAVSFKFMETSFCFIGSHLAARGERIIQRGENYQKIVKMLELGSDQYDIMHDFDHVIWLGDLNYRIHKVSNEPEIPENSSPEQIKVIKTKHKESEFIKVNAMIKGGEIDTLLEFDQLNQEIAADRAFVGFKEGKITWPPTYRMLRETNEEYSNKKHQPPSYTDRVLWHSLLGQELKLEEYQSAPNTFSSDHRPVYAIFSCEPRLHYYGLSPNANPNLIQESKQPKKTLEFVVSNIAFESQNQNVDVKSNVYIKLDAAFATALVQSEQVSCDADTGIWRFPSDLTVTPFHNDVKWISSHVIKGSAHTHDEHGHEFVEGYFVIPVVNVFKQGFDARDAVRSRASSRVSTSTSDLTISSDHSMRLSGTNIPSRLGRSGTHSVSGSLGQTRFMVPCRFAGLNVGLVSGTITCYEIETPLHAK